MNANEKKPVQAMCVSCGWPLTAFGCADPSRAAMLLALGEAYCLCPPRLRKSLRHKALTMASALANAVKVRREREEAG